MRLSERAWQIVTALSMTAGRGPLARAVADAAELTPADRVVDIGCGPGTAVRHAARQGAAATGVDPDPAMLRLARWITALRRPPDVSWLQGRAEKLPLPDDQATVVWAISSAHHWEDRGTGIGEAWRVLAPGGRLVLAERLARPGARGHAAHGLTRDHAEDLARQLADAGFGQERQQQALGVRLFDVADGERGAVHRRGHPRIAFGAVPGRPGRASCRCRLWRPRPGRCRTGSC